MTRELASDDEAEAGSEIPYRGLSHADRNSGQGSVAFRIPHP